MVWHDELNCNAVDTNLWKFDYHSEWKFSGIVTKHTADNLIIDGKGKLVIKVSKDDQNTVLYNRGVITKYEKAYGYFEARVQFSTQPSCWSAFWLSSYPYNECDDCFSYAQEFDIFEDFYKPRKESDIQQRYHANSGLPFNVKGGEFGIVDMSNCNVMSKHTLPKKISLKRYKGWHIVALEWTPLEHIFYINGKDPFRLTCRDCAVTTVPKKIWLSGCYSSPKDTSRFTFYGILNKAKLPDQYIVDYVRVYDEDWRGNTAPVVSVETANSKLSFAEGEQVEFRINAKYNDGSIKTLYLFSKVRIRAEENVDSAYVDHQFAVTNLFPSENTIIAMAKDNDGRVGMSAMIHVNIEK